MTETLTATEFKAKCLDILDRLGTGEIQRVAVTKRGRVVAILTPPPVAADEVRKLHGFMRGSVMIPPGTDLTRPVLAEPTDAEQGILHR